ncbi:MAG: hypothetical protein HYV29_02245 [Ignavibacteriales bacterium]|nr:hypothetical protein [Ignavibacteriales bacterium]
MDYAFLSLFAFFGLYTVLFYGRRSLEHNPSHSFLLRIILTCSAWCTVIAATTYVTSLTTMTIGLFMGDPNVGYEFVIHLVVLIVIVRVYVYYDDSLALSEMKNFFREALLFGNYFRKRDHEIREEIDRHEVRRIYREVTNKELTSEVTATPFDHYAPPLSKDRVPEQKISRRIHAENIRGLILGERIDVTEAFHLELMGNKAHAYLPLINDIVIDGKNFSLMFSLILPLEQRIRWDEPNARQRTIERIYELLVILTSLPWFTAYDRFVRVINVTLYQTELNDEVREELKEELRCEIPLSKLRARGTMITPASEVEKMAKITFLK